MKKCIKNMFPYVIGLLVGLILSILSLVMIKQDQHHIMRKLTSINPNLIEIVCNYEYCVLGKIKCKKLKTYFSIDLLKKQVTGGDYDSYGIFLPEDTIADVTPSNISINQYWQVAEEPKHQFLINKFFVDRFTGFFYGEHRKFDEKSTYGNVKTVITNEAIGKCRPIEDRLF